MNKITSFYVANSRLFFFSSYLFFYNNNNKKNPLRLIVVKTQFTEDFVYLSTVTIHDPLLNFVWL